MELAHPEFLPERPPDREEMRTLQRRIHELARFEDDLGRPIPPDPDAIVVGVDIAYDGNDAIAAAVALRDGAVIADTTVRRLTQFPYVPGYLAFREAGPVVDAIRNLSVTPDVIVTDGNGRIHPREAGLATHVGVTIDRPALGVAKRLLCGTVLSTEEGPYEEGTRLPVVAGEESTAPAGATLGYAVQTRQWYGREHPINPVFVSAGHRVSADTAANIVLATCDGYKLPEPVRLADQLAGERARDTSRTATG